MIVERRRWLNPAEFTDLLALCQFLPGANVVNLSIVLGGRFQGARGAAAALAGLLAGPICVVLAFGALQQRYGSVPIVAHGMAGLSAGASGLVLATALRIAAPLRSRPRSLVIAALSFAGLAIAGLGLPLVLAGLVPASIAIHWWRRGG
jgi:chromate transporter